MALRQRKQRRRASITSLIDVIFLLLLFFMLASAFTKYSEVEISSAPTGGQQTNRSAMLQLQVHQSFINLEGTQLTLGERSSALQQHAHDNRRIIAVSVSEETTTQRLIDTLRQLDQAGSFTIHVLEPS